MDNMKTREIIGNHKWECGDEQGAEHLLISPLLLIKCELGDITIITDISDETEFVSLAIKGRMKEIYDWLIRKEEKV